MGKYLLVGGLTLLCLLATVRVAFASSTQAYQDYLYQFDAYRSSYNEFKIAKGEYTKYQTLTAQTTALEKTKAMLEQRDKLLRSYLQLLGEKLNENPGLSASDQPVYLGLIRNEMTFLEDHGQLVASAASLADTDAISKQLESHYPLFQVSIRQVITALSLGQLSAFASAYDATARQALDLINANRSTLSSDQVSLVDRWMLQITSKRQLYQQKYEAVTSANAQLKPTTTSQLDQSLAKMQKDINSAKQSLYEGTSFIDELTNVLRYKN